MHHILTNEIYAGIWRFRKFQIDGGKKKQVSKAETLSVEVPVVIARELWQSAQERLAYNRKNYRCVSKYEYLLSRRVYCGECHSKMQVTPNHSSNGTTYFYY